MTDMYMNKVRGASSKTSPSSRAARRRRIELRRIKPSAEYDSEAKRQKLESPRDHGNSFMNHEDGVQESPENDKSEGAEAVLKSPAVLSLVEGMEVTPKYGMASVCGRRRNMEDVVAIQPKFCGKGDELGLHFFGVYDGHGCSHVATKCGERLHGIVKEELENTDNSSGEWENVMQRSFSSMDQEVANCNKNNTSIGSGSCRCELRYPESDAVGSTAVTAVITADKIIVANCGDSRAVLCRGGKAIPLSTDHKVGCTHCGTAHWSLCFEKTEKPDRPDELSRIQAAGGRVIYWDGPRVLGVLAMSRAIGDSYLKPYVSSEPEVTETDRTAEDECLILASDGLWDVVSNETACGMARMCLKAGNQTCSEEERVSGDGSSDKACSVASMLLTKLALSRRSSDNVTVVVIDLKRDM